MEQLLRKMAACSMLLMIYNQVIVVDVVILGVFLIKFVFIG